MKALLYPLAFWLYLAGVSVHPQSRSNGLDHTFRVTTPRSDSSPSSETSLPTPVEAPSMAAGLQAFTVGQESSPGGSVPAGIYACKVTYTGASGGETRPSAPSESVTAAANSALYCAANDAPAGASTYNVYWQTGGRGAFYRGHTHVPFGVQDAQFSAPPTSGPEPPETNTATSLLSSAQAGLGRKSGAIVVPADVEGNPGEPLSGQRIDDGRTGAILQRMGVGSPQKSTTGSVMNYGLYQDIVLPNHALSSHGQQMNGIGVSVQQGDGGPRYGMGLPPFAATVGLFVRQYRFGDNRNWIWAENPLTWIANQNANAYVVEAACYNNSPSPATGDTGCTGYNILSEGKQPAFNAINVGGVQKWANGLVIQTRGVTNAGILIGPGNPHGIYNESPDYLAAASPAHSGMNQPAPGLYFQSNVWTGSANSQDTFRIVPSYAGGPNPERVLNFAVAAAAGTRATEYAFQGGEIRSVHNSAVPDSGSIDADTAYLLHGSQIATSALSDGATVIRSCGTTTFSASTASVPLSCSWVTPASHCQATWIGSNVSGGALGYTPGKATVSLTAATANSGSASVACSVH